MTQPGNEGVAPLTFDVQSAPEFTSDRVTPDHTASGGTPEPPPQPSPGDSWRERVARVRGGKDGKDTPPPPPAKEPKRPVPPMPRPGSIAKPLTEMYGTLGLVVFGFDQACGTSILLNAGDAAKSLEELARVNPRARRVILALTQTGAVSQVIAAHLPILTVVAVHHGPKDLANLLRPLAVHLNSEDEDVPKGEAATAALGDLLANMNGDESAA